MRPTFKINGVDFAAMVNKFNYTLKYEKVLGQNSGTMKNGDYTEDLIRWRAVLTLSTNAMSAAEAKQLLQALTEGEAVITYDDARTGTQRTVWCAVELGKSRAAYYESGALVWRDGASITLTEVRDFA